MSEIEKMKRYIERTDFQENSVDGYYINLGELSAIGNAVKSDPFHTLCLLFEYGKAKGYRAAKAERRAKA